MTDEDLAELIAQLVDGWVAFVSDAGPPLSDWRGRSEAQVATITTLTAHVHTTAMILRPVLPDGLTIAHMPLVRSIFEATITVAWCDEVADGAHALINEGARQRRNLQKELAETRSMRQMADLISGVDAGTLPTSSVEQARRMRARCNDVAFDGAYAMYRMLSSMSHASMETIDAYLDDESLRPGKPLSIKSSPGALSSSRAWAHMVASCLVWSGMVTNYLDRTRSRRSELRRIARALEIQPELPVKLGAHQRGTPAPRKS